MPSQAETAQKQWELENKIKEVDYDSLYKFDEEAYIDLINNKQPWRKDPNYFKDVKISAIALLKMIMHAGRGGTIEVMGVVQGKVIDRSFIILDAFALPVEGTETRVNAGQDAVEYQGKLDDLSRMAGRNEYIVGWYHSHPGYGCWLSGIDVGTQSLQQQSGPYVAIVVDPIQTLSSGRVNIGAFRTYPQDYQPERSSPNDYRSIPSKKIQDYGKYYDRYYELEIEFFKSSSDKQLLSLLWNKYWIKTLSTSPLLSNKEYSTEQIFDLSKKLTKVEHEVSRTSKFGGHYHEEQQSSNDSELKKVDTDNSKMSCESIHGVITQLVKHSLFNHRPCRHTNESMNVE